MHRCQNLKLLKQLKLNSIFIIYWNNLLCISFFSLNIITDNYVSFLFLSLCGVSRAVTILDSSYHGYCGHENSQYLYIAISIDTLGGGGGSISQISFFLLCLLSFAFSPNERKETDKRRAQDSGFLFFGAHMKLHEIKYCQV